MVYIDFHSVINSPHCLVKFKFLRGAGMFDTNYTVYHKDQILNNSQISERNTNINVSINFLLYQSYNIQNFVKFLIPALMPKISLMLDINEPCQFIILRPGFHYFFSLPVGIDDYFGKIILKTKVVLMKCNKNLSGFNLF